MSVVEQRAARAPEGPTLSYASPRPRLRIRDLWTFDRVVLLSRPRVIYLVGFAALLTQAFFDVPQRILGIAWAPRAIYQFAGLILPIVNLAAAVVLLRVACELLLLGSRAARRAGLLSSDEADDANDT